MNDSSEVGENRPFALQPDPPDQHEEAMILAILKDLDIPQDRRPLQCVTFKQPLPEYFRLKEVCQKWKLRYSDLLRIFLRVVIVVLDAPTGEVLEYLEKHREAELERDRVRKEARRKRTSLHAALP